MFTGIKDKLILIKEGMGGRQFLALLLFLVILFAIPLSVYLVKQRQEIRSKASPARSLSLVFKGAPQSVATGNTFSADVVLQGSSQATYTGADVTITYPADKVTLVSFTPPSSPALNEDIWRDPNPLLNTGTFRYIAVNKGNPTPASFITLGTLTFKMTATADDAQLNFGGTSQAVVLEEVEPFIASATGGQQLTVSPVTITVAVTPTTPPLPVQKVGDADGNNCVDNKDRAQWVKERTGDCHRCTNWSGEAAGRRNYGQDYTLWYTAFANKPSLCTTATVPNCTTIACQ